MRCEVHDVRGSLGNERTIGENYRVIEKESPRDFGVGLREE